VEGMISRSKIFSRRFKIFDGKKIGIKEGLRHRQTKRKSRNTDREKGKDK